MVVISAAILSKTTTLVARQFVDVSRLRIEGVLSAFLRLVETGSKDHTYVENDSVRYVYLPLETLYLVLITNKQSNILEDLETLKLMQRIVQAYCESPVNEDTVLTNAFSIIFALDEIICFGYRESVTLNQVKSYTEMESHDEKLSLMVEEEKMKEERRRGQQIASRLEKERRERQRKKQTSLQLVQTVTAATLQTTGANPTDETLGGIVPLSVATTTTTTSIGMQQPSGVICGASHVTETRPGKGMQLGKASTLTPHALL